MAKDLPSCQRHRSEGDARGDLAARVPRDQSQHGRMPPAGRKMAGTQALRLQIFKRSDLEVSHKLGSGSYGGVWQARILPTRAREAVETVVVKVVWPDADLDGFVGSGFRLDG